jgi:hypothetical protein
LSEAKSGTAVSIRQLDCTPWVRHENGDRLPGMFDMPEWTMDVY